MKSGIPEAVRESLEILQIQLSMRGNDRSGGEMEETIGRVVGVFQKVGADWALVGAHAIGMLTEPRATMDFDFVVDDRKLGEVLDGLHAEFGELETIDIGAAILVKTIAVDLIRSSSHALFGEALRTARIVEEWRIPETECLIALKYLAAIGPWRARAKRTRDVADLIAVYQGNLGRLDRERLVRLGGLAYPGAEREFRALLDRIDRGEAISI
jgi:hypothetical protein